MNKRHKEKQPAGIRMVKSEETGKPGITFKIRDPDQDLIILMEREEEVVVDNQKRILHRAGKAIFHK